MTINDIVSIISTVGFPIVACGAMFWKINKQDTQHKEEMVTLAKAIENNTMALTAMKEVIDSKL